MNISQETSTCFSNANDLLGTKRQKDNSNKVNFITFLQEEEENVNKPKNSSGRWTREEHSSFLKGLQTFGKDWQRISDYMKTRTPIQVRSHAQKYFEKLQPREIKSFIPNFSPKYLWICN